jgi:hypothetical protein
MIHYRDSNQEFYFHLNSEYDHFLLSTRSIPFISITIDLTYNQRLTLLSITASYILSHHHLSISSFLLLLLFPSSCLLPRQVLVLDVLYRVVQPDHFFLLVLLLLHLPPLLLLPLQLPVLLFLVSLLENLQLLVCPFNHIVQLIDILVQLVLALLCLCCQFLRFLLDVHVLTVQVLFQFLVYQRFCLDRRFQVFNFYRKGFFRLFENSSLVGKFGLGFFVKVTDLNL